MINGEWKKKLRESRKEKKKIYRKKESWRGRENKKQEKKWEVEKVNKYTQKGQREKASKEEGKGKRERET